MLGPVEKASFQVGSGDLNKTSERHPKKKGHTIEECIEFKNAVPRLFIMDSIMNTWDDGVILACDESRLHIPVTEKIIFYRCSFTPFKTTMMEIYSELV